jgi:hypothetical protein
MAHLPRILTAMPPLPHVQLEIAKAILTLAPENDRRIEIASRSSRLTVTPS